MGRIIAPAYADWLVRRVTEDIGSNSICSYNTLISLFNRVPTLYNDTIFLYNQLWFYYVMIILIIVIKSVKDYKI